MANFENFPSSHTSRFATWQSAYQDALNEVEPRRLHERVQVAEEAIFLRMQTSLAHSSEGRIELNDIGDAISALHAIDNHQRRPLPLQRSALSAAKFFRE